MLQGVSLLLGHLAACSRAGQGGEDLHPLEPHSLRGEGHFSQMSPVIGSHLSLRKGGQGVRGVGAGGPPRFAGPSPSVAGHAPSVPPRLCSRPSTLLGSQDFQGRGECWLFCSHGPQVAGVGLW